MPLADEVKELILENNLLPESGRVLVAVSGGADSLCAAGVLRELGYPIAVAHFDHHLRPDSGKDAEQVRAMAEGWSVPFRLGSGDVRAESRRRRKTIEETARCMRYEFLLGEAQAGEFPSVATGHTADDQAETVLMHLLRGAGSDGLRGMLPKMDLAAWLDPGSPVAVRLIRPILGIRREQTEAYCLERGWTPVEDATNHDAKFWRNRIRMQLMPALRAYNPRVVEHLASLAGVMRSQAEFLDAQAAEIWEEIVQTPAEGEVLIARDRFNALPLALRREMIRKAVTVLVGNRTDLAYRHIRKAIDFAEHPTSTHRCDLVLGLELRVEDGWLRMYQPGRTTGERPVTWDNRTLEFGGSVRIADPDWEFSLNVAAREAEFSGGRTEDSYQVRIPMNMLEAPLFLRTRRPGDRFVPVGMDRPVRLSDFMAAQHLPAGFRNRWPLVCDRRGILWVPGYRLDRRAQDDGSEEDCLVLTARRLESKPI